jgi:hypothetical protein
VLNLYVALAPDKANKEIKQVQFSDLYDEMKTIPLESQIKFNLLRDS